MEEQDTQAPQTTVTQDSVDTELEPIKQADDRLQWYVVSVRSGHEKKVAKKLEQRIKAQGKEEMIAEVLVPTQQKVVAKEGKKKNVVETLMPGYVLILMELNDDTWQLVRYTEGVQGFVGETKTPEPLSQGEVDAMRQFGQIEQTTYKSSFVVGEAVKIVDGPFKDFIGEIREINEKKGQLTVLLTMFGREVPKDVDFIQVTKLSN
jgi:transcriptional antiterminator NusG